jgi:hypothetical protein
MSDTDTDKLAALTITAQDVEDVREHGEMNVRSYEVAGERPERQAWEWHQGKRLLALADRMERASIEAFEATMVEQRGDSDCFNACLASLTGIPLEEFPVFTVDEMRRSPVLQDNRCMKVLRQHGWYWLRAWTTPLQGYTIASGPSPRGDWWHSVIYHDGKPAFDPHPSNEFLAGPVHEYLLPVQMAFTQETGEDDGSHSD